VAAPLLGADQATGDRTVDELLEASMVESAGPDRYRVHDLARLFAAGKLAADPQAERDAARARLDDFLLITTIGAGLTFEIEQSGLPWTGGRHLSGRDEAGRWLAREVAHWLAALRGAAQRGAHRLVVHAAEALHWYSDRHHAPEVWPELFALGVRSARAAGLPIDEARQRNYLGWAHSVCEGLVSAAVEEHRSALRLARDTGDRREQAWSLMYLGQLGVRAEPAEAVRRCTEAVVLMSATGSGIGTAQARFYLGLVLHEAGRYAEADEEFRAAEAGHLSPSDQDGPDGTVASGLAAVRAWYAKNLLHVGRPALALRTALRAADGFRAQRNQRGLARVLLTAAQADVQRGDVWAAVRRLDVAADFFADLAATAFEVEALLTAAELYERVGQLEQAAAVRRRMQALAARIEGDQRSRPQDGARGRDMPETG
jgi:tetratricopeptide (TPR) repeat protein